ncbi:class A beta-lactamase [Actinoplanes sp. NEAU-A12]|uniref:Class A beta-lactamase n=1 Tax=Actinoplanes sandaracinus TaxID=3045177 RepID=A0ABT6WGP9_9ACTN|nr:class A beta-lactamase [Actinoplanes sandaracinus]MDI6098896.1 class A beta-lactamase [Actinoplanes sandaracinus]
MTRPTITRRAAIGAAALLLAGCARKDEKADTSAGRPSPSPSGSAPASPPATVPGSEERHDRLVELERRFSARLGVYAVATGTGATVAHQADERFPYCSAFKGLAAAAVLNSVPLSKLDQRVRFTRADVEPNWDNSRKTRERVATGMTLGELCDAAVRFSDGTAGNLLLRQLGGPAELTAYLRTLGDTVTLAERTEPALWRDWTPGDQRDTTSARAIGTDYHKIVAGGALPGDARAYLRDLLERAHETPNSRNRIRAVVPRGWTVANKTGTGGPYGPANDIAVVWPSKSAEPLLISIMSRRSGRDAAPDNTLVAEAARYVLDKIT